MSEDALPANWVACALSDIGKVVSGGTPSTAVSDYWGDEVRWISPSDLTGYRSKFISRGAKSLSALGLDNCSAKLMPAGSVHFSSRAPIGYVVISAESLCTNQGFKSLVLGEGVFNEYVYFYLGSIRALANSLATGTTFKELSGSAFGKLPFPLPPLAEQKRIVAKIEELFSELEAGEESLRVARRQLGVYRQSLLKQAFEGKLTAHWRTQNPDKLESPAQLLGRIRSARAAYFEMQLAEWTESAKEWERSGALGKRPAKPRKPTEVGSLTDEAREHLAATPSSWAAIPLGETLTKLTNGLVCEQHESPPGIPVSRIETISSSTVNFERVRYVRTAEPEKLKRFFLRPSDILFSHINSDSHLGKAAVFQSRDQLLHGMNLLVMRFADGVDSWFAFHYFNHLRWSGYFVSIAQHAVNQSSLNQGKIEAVPFPLCSFPEQQEIVRLLDQQFEVIDQNEREIDAALKRSEALRQSILKEAFTGRLVPQNPSDEPASQLLARLRAERFPHKL